MMRALVVDDLSAIRFFPAGHGGPPIGPAAEKGEDGMFQGTLYFGLCCIGHWCRMGIDLRFTPDKDPYGNQGGSQQKGRQRYGKGGFGTFRFMSCV